MKKIEVPALVGSKVKTVRQMTPEEAEAECWYHPTIVIEFTNGVKIYASGDDEGNRSGTMFGQYKEQSFYIMEE